MSGGPVGAEVRELRSTAPEAQSKTNRASAPPLSVELFVVYEEPVPNGKFVDTPSFPRLGYVHQRADASFGKLKDILVEGTWPPRQVDPQSRLCAFDIKLFPEDARVLASLTQTNLGKRILIMVGTNLVTAPVVRAPLEDGSFVIQSTNTALAVVVEKDLKRMRLPKEQ